ncbi:MAG: hypothetical protein WA761_01950 [Thermoplasmata archaeon]
MRTARTRPAVPRRGRVTTYITPPKLSSFPVEREQIEYSSRSIVFRSNGEGILRAWGPARTPWILEVVPEGQRWKVRTWSGTPAEARAAARELFSLDHPIEQFYRMARSEPILSPAIRRFRGLRIPRDANLYEALLHSIIGQQLSVRAANTMKERLFAATEAWIEVEGIRVPHIPTPDRLEALGIEGLRQVGLSGVKSRSLLALARREATGYFDTHQWRDLPLSQAVERLDAEPGVGRWTAENALLRGVGRPDVFIAGDLGIRYALVEYGVVKEGVREELLRQWADRLYPEWGSYVTLYLWRRLVAGRQAEGG